MKEGETQPEISIERWDYESQFKEYLIRVAREGKTKLEPIGNFPKRIELNDKWHNTLNKMRVQTRDGHERWTPIGFNRDMSSIVIPTDFLSGEEDNIPVTVDEDEIIKYRELCLVNLAGDIHSHTERLKGSYFRRFVTSGRFLREYRGFSPRDLKGVLELSSSASPLHIFGVVDAKANFFALLTKDTKTIPHDSHLQDNSEFSFYWFNRYAPAVVERFPPVTSTLWDINIGIAQEYKLSLYRGSVGEDLVRGFP